MIRKILVPVRGDGKGDNVLAHAAVLARRFDAHLQVTHCRARPEDLLPFGVPFPAFLKAQLADSAKKLAEFEEEGLVQELRKLASELGLVFADNANDEAGVTVSWTEEQGKQPDVIKHHGRLADVIAVAQPDRAQNIGFNTLKAALFLTGRPVMMCPPAETAPETLGANVSVAWNGSLEASRAVSLTEEILVKADKVTILRTGELEPHGATSNDLVAYLGDRGVAADVHRFSADGRIGEALLDESHKLGADLMIMGAYGDSHEREVLLGGNTQTVVDTSTMPVVFVH